MAVSDLGSRLLYNDVMLGLFIVTGKLIEISNPN